MSGRFLLASFFLLMVVPFSGCGVEEDTVIGEDSDYMTNPPDIRQADSPPRVRPDSSDATHLARAFGPTAIEVIYGDGSDCVTDFECTYGGYDGCICYVVHCWDCNLQQQIHNVCGIEICLPYDDSPYDPGYPIPYEEGEAEAIAR